ncbi:Hsp33 family molecular chaperone HslO [Thorsellia kenyensis]|uniref:33 kDa chaperonin n=1 Tax=Thorsellia kenyensis TaxID=1549888 RepID=A0ABV6CCI3_9GAMM
MTHNTTSTAKNNDLLHRFLFEEHAARGEMVTVTQTLQDMLTHHHYPEIVQSLLGELLVATSLLTATLKFEGDITVQLQGDGLINLLVINGNDKQQMRGTAKYDEEIKNLEQFDMHSLFGSGYIVITVMPKEGERYQGIVALEGESISACLEAYFAQSEQLDTKLYLFSQLHNGKMHAAGMFLQVMPGEKDEDEHFFEHISQLTRTIKPQELFDLSIEEVLHRLYHEDSVRLYTPQAVTFFCHCSEERCLSALATLGEAEIQSLLDEQPVISFNCDFCGKGYEFDAQTIKSAFNPM